MIKSINKRVEKNILYLEIETTLKAFYSHKNVLLTEEQVFEIAKTEHEIESLISSPPHNVGNYFSTGTKNVGTWAFKLKPKPRAPRKKTKPAAQKKTLTKSSLRSKINKIAKDLNSE